MAETKWYVTNPETGYIITVGGTTYEKLKLKLHLDQLTPFTKQMIQQQQELKQASPQWYVINPETKHHLKVGGELYEKLKLKHHLDQQTPFSKPVPVRKHVAPVAPQLLEQMREMKVQQRLLSQTLEQPNLQPAKLKHLKQVLQKAEQGRGRPVRGWGAESPSKGSQRHQLKEKCGNKCFLIPESEGFPICPKCLEGKCTCAIDCRGLTAAKARAHKFKYENLYEAIDRLHKEKCGSVGSAPKAKRQPPS